MNLATRDLPAAREFYTAVLGWTFRSASHEDNYLIAFLDDTPVAGLADASAAIGGPLAWTPYFAVPDLGSAAGNAQDRGGMVAVGPLGVAHGRAAIAADPQGARFGMWQGRAPASWHPCHGEPPARLDLHTRDAFAAAMYYGELFGWQNDEDSECCSVEYEQETVVVRSRRHVVGTLYSGSAEQPPDPRVTTWWEVTFYVDDPEAARSAAGGSGVHTPDRLHPDAADVRLTDPSGVPFSVRKLR
ncbi:VOC family protein [Streptomyces sulphureus]|uniref:VOC family protein n=1 Tax=Streptomyces sulphureus TaxID=47758 RepID=UPI0003A3BE79|nr:VOC family protein [Streptomyces sulphureus]